MKIEELRKEAFFVYVKFRRYYGPNPSYTMFYGEKEQTLLNNFFDLLEGRYELETLGGSFFLDYFYHAFSFWRDRDAALKNGNVPFLNWIIGKKGFDRWVNRGGPWKYHARRTLGKMPDELVMAVGSMGSVTKKIKSKYIEDRISVNIKPKHLEKINSWEEFDKKLLHNTEEGYINCLEYTSLYHKKSIFCVRCKWKKKCKSVLSEEFPEIAKLRNLDGKIK